MIEKKEGRKKEGRKRKTVGVTKATFFSSQALSLHKGNSEVTWLLFGARICGLRSQEGEILISQKYVKGRRRRGGGEKKITCREHEYQGRHA